MTIPVIDVFAGPGGLNEGFSRFGEDEGAPSFSTIGSFEMDATACATLRLRHTFHQLVRSPGGVPESYYEFIRGERTLSEFVAEPEISDAYAAAESSVHQVELGIDRSQSDELIASALSDAGAAESAWVLVGGPPCQAYSLVGRSRRRNDAAFEDDHKHFLYREYLHILETFEPPVFVMENVKGLLSSTNRGTRMFDLIREDLENAGSRGYELHSFVVDSSPAGVRPRDFIIQSEDFGIPQKRHRVIILGIRKGFLAPGRRPTSLVRNSAVSVHRAIGHLPPVRSGLSPARDDSLAAWREVRSQARRRVDAGAARVDHATVRGGAFVRSAPERPDGAFERWVSDTRVEGFIQHESRTHMASDLSRYYFAAHLARAVGRSPKLGDFPEELLPNHANVNAEYRPFEDRFRVQLATEPSSTVTSHISKDGHYYIHYDPEQMRSLTVREAARLQTFPDNYYFSGNRTQQYHQVGNAVPPLLATQLAGVVAELFLSRAASEPEISGVADDHGVIEPEPALL